MNTTGRGHPVVSRYAGTTTSTTTTVHTVNSKARFAKVRFYIKGPNSTVSPGGVIVGGTQMANLSTAASSGSINSSGGTAASSADANLNNKKFMGEYIAKPSETVQVICAADTAYYSVEVEEYY